MIDSERVNNAVDTLRVIIDDLKRRVIVRHYPKKRFGRFHYIVPDNIHGVDILTYLMNKYGMTKSNADFIYSTIRDTSAVQPTRGSDVIIGNENQPHEHLYQFDSRELGNYKVYGKKVLSAYNSRFVDNTLALFIANDSTYVLVHDFQNQYNGRTSNVVEIYYHKDLNELVNYANMVASRRLFNYFLQKIQDEGIYSNDPLDNQYIRPSLNTDHLQPQYN